MKKILTLFAFTILLVAVFMIPGYTIDNTYLKHCNVMADFTKLPILKGSDYISKSIDSVITPGTVNDNTFNIPVSFENDNTSIQFSKYATTKIYVNISGINDGSIINITNQLVNKFSEKMFFAQGDVNDDDVINIADISEILVADNYGCFSKNAKSPLADVNNDNVIDIADISIVLSTASYGKTSVSIDISCSSTIIKISNISVKPGEKNIRIPVTITNNPGILGMTMRLNYDENIITITGAENGEALSDALTFTVPKVFNKNTLYTWDGQDLADEQIKDGTILVLTADISETATPGNYSIGFTYSEGDIIDNSLLPVNVDISEGNINVSSPTSLNQYTVTFKDFDGSVLKTEIVEEGYSATPPTNPTRAGYVFTGWSNDFTNITQNTTVIAEYRVLNEPTISIGSISGQPGEIINVPVYIINNPGVLGMTLKCNYNDSAFTIIGATNGDAVSDVLTFTVPKVFNKDTQYTWDGQDLPPEYIKDGTILLLKIKISETATMGDYPISFTCSDGDVIDNNLSSLNVAFNEGTLTVLTPVVPQSYTVTFKDYDGRTLKVETVEKGMGATAPVSPARDGYIFTGWDKNFKSITADTTITAQYSKISGVSLSVGSVTGTTGDVIEVPIRLYNNPGILGMTFKCDYDDSAISIIGAVSGEAVSDVLTFTVPRVFNKNTQYTWDGQDISPEQIKDGVVLTLTIKILDNTATGNYPLTIQLADGDIIDNYLSPVNATITAGNISVITQSLNEDLHSVKFVNYDGSVLKEEIVNTGSSATAPDNPTREGYIFSGWDKNYSDITTDLIVTATYNKINGATIAISSINANAGETIDIPIYLYNNPGILGMTIKCDYDENAISVLGARTGDAFSESLTFTVPKVFNKDTQYAWDGQDISTEQIKDGLILTLTVKISEDASDGTYNINIIYSDGDIIDNNLSPVSVVVEGGKVII